MKVIPVFQVIEYLAGMFILISFDGVLRMSKDTSKVHRMAVSLQQRYICSPKEIILIANVRLKF